jgi:hypothetical protein
VSVRTELRERARIESPSLVVARNDNGGIWHRAEMSR